MSTNASTYAELKRANIQATTIINEVWGEHVAWVEDFVARTNLGGEFVVPVIRSRLVGGKLPGRADAPRFFGGPAVNRIK